MMTTSFGLTFLAALSCGIAWAALTPNCLSVIWGDSVVWGDAAAGGDKRTRFR